MGDHNDPLHAEYPMVRRLEANGYDVSYTTHIDTARRGVLILNPPGASATNVPLDATVGATLSEPILAGALALVVTNAAGETIPGTIAYNDATHRVVFTPAAPLSRGATYTAILSGARDLAGNVMAATTWTFTTRATG